MEDDKEFIEYKNRLMKKYTKKFGKIRNSWGSKYIYRSVDKTHILRTVDECTFLAIVRNINRSLADELAVGTPVHLPHLGTFYISKGHRKRYKTKNNFTEAIGVDWDATHRLWFKDKEAEKEKFLVLCKSFEQYNIVWKKMSFKNVMAFRFRACRDLKGKLKNNIKQGVNILTYDRTL